MPATLAPETFTEATVQNAYALAAKIKKVLYQQPCYCHCDRQPGTAVCSIATPESMRRSAAFACAKRLYAYEQTQKGKTPAQIREGIEKGDWKTGRYDEVSDAGNIGKVASRQSSHLAGNAHPVNLPAEGHRDFAYSRIDVRVFELAECRSP